MYFNSARIHFAVTMYVRGVGRLSTEMRCRGWQMY